ncbi:MAG: glycosyltransferase [Pseudomonadota bacterium]
MRIAVVGPSYPFKGGIPLYTTGLYRELQRRHEVLFIAFSRQYPDWLYPGDSDRDASNVELQEPAARALIDSLNPLSWHRAAVAISEYQADVIIFPWWVMYWALPFSYMASMLRRKLPESDLLFVCHNVTAHETSALSRFLTRQTLRRGHGFLVHSSRERKDLEKLLPEASIACAEHPAYDLDNEGLPTRASAKESLAVEGDVLLFFGFVRPYKGLDVLIEAMSLLHKPCTLLIAGEVWGSREAYDHRIEELGLADRVRFVDRYIAHDDVGSYFRAADLVVLPYLSATGSGVVKLAYSYHRPVVVSAVGSLPEAVRPGETGEIVKPGDAAALAGAIDGYLQRHDRDAVERAVASHVQSFDWKTVVDALASLWRKPDQ